MDEISWLGGRARVGSPFVTKIDSMLLVSSTVAAGVPCVLRVAEMAAVIDSMGVAVEGSPSVLAVPID
tara:strand:+ start:1588 stop:1791 length:204 start_codon:yes stop_codon:yes gene_type:complete